MARPLFEQYKDALRRGHVALLEGELDEALAAYHQAASLVPDRPLPHASIGTVLGRLGRRNEALEAFDRALAISPSDEAALQARAALLEEAPHPPPTTTEPAMTPPVGEPSAPAEGAASAEGAPPAEEPVPEGAWPAVDLPSPPVGPPPDPAALQAEAEAFLDGAEAAAARDPLLLAMAVHREAGRLDAALDACLQLLAIAPGDPRVHLAIVDLQLDRGWRAVATEKIELLLRLTALTGDAQAEADVHLLAADRLREESTARPVTRREGVPPA